MSYTNQTAIEGYLDTDLDARTIAELADWITAVEDWINNYCGTDFEDSADATKYYDGNNERYLDIDPVTSLTSVTTLDNSGNTDTDLTEGAGNDYLLYPLNSAQKTRIELTVNSSIGSFSKGQRRVKVVGRFRSYTAVPKVIKLAATKLVAKIIEQQAGKDVKSESLGDYSISYEQPDIDEMAEAMGITNLLDAYKVYTL